MATKTPTIAEAKTDRVALLKEQGLVTAKLETIIKTLPNTPIRNEAEYAKADEHRAAAKGMLNYFTGLIEKPKASIRQALNDLLDSVKVVQNDANRVIEHETNRMKAFRFEEQKKLRAAEEAADKERARLQAIADAQAQRAAMLKSATAKEKAMDKAAEAQVAAEMVSVKVEKVEAENSTDRVYKKVRVIDKWALIKHIAASRPELGLADLLDINMPQLNAFFKLQEPQPPVGKWFDGVEVYRISISLAGGRRD